MAASWHRDDRLLPFLFTFLALVIWDRRGPALAAAVALVTCLYHFEAVTSVFGIVAYTFFFRAIIGLRTKRAAGIGFGIGAGLALLNLRWLVAEFDSRWAGLVLAIVAVYAGIFMAAVAALIRSPLVRRPGSLGIALTTLAIPALEYVRITVPRFGTANLYSGHLVVANLDLAQASHWVGAGGLCALMAFCSYATAAWLVHERRATWAPRLAARRLSRRRLCIALFLILSTIIAGKLDRRRTARNHVAQELKVAIIQAGNSPPTATPAATPYVNSLNDCCQTGTQFDLLFLPEGAISIGPWNAAEASGEPIMSLAELQKKFGSLLHCFWITGAMVREEIGSKIGFRNTAVSFDPDFRLLGQIDKQLGAPLVEVNPFRGIPVLDTIGEQATHLSRRMISQPNPGVLPIGSKWRAVVAICSEHQWPDIWARRGVSSLASIDFQLILSDLTWFDASIEERDQSRRARRLLAAKYRRPLLYVASSGSEFWDQNGNLVRSLPIRAGYGIWQISIPSLEGHTSVQWDPPDEVWPLLVFVGLFFYRWFKSKRRKSVT